jgi:hypothetical protein
MMWYLQMVKLEFASVKEGRFINESVPIVRV